MKKSRKMENVKEINKEMDKEIDVTDLKPSLMVIPGIARLAQGKDFIFFDREIKRFCIGIKFYVQNNDGTFDCFTTSKNTNVKELDQAIKHKRVYLI